MSPRAGCCASPPLNNLERVLPVATQTNQDGVAPGCAESASPPGWLILLTRTPLPVLHGIASLVALLAPLVLQKRFRQIEDHLALAFPDIDAEARRRRAGDFARNLADVALESFKAYTMGEDELNARVRIANIEVFDRFVQANQSIILLGSHEANWEWTLLSCSSQLPFKIQAAYKPRRGARVQAFMRNLRTRFGAVLFAPAEAAQAIIEGRKSLRAIVLTVDEKPAADEECRWVRFFNQDTAFRSSFEKVALLWRYPVVFASRRRTSRGHYEVSFQILGEPPYDAARCALVEAYAAALQHSIAANPADWLWTQRRWQVKRAYYA